MWPEICVLHPVVSAAVCSACCVESARSIWQLGPVLVSSHIAEIKCPGRGSSGKQDWFWLPVHCGVHGEGAQDSWSGSVCSQEAEDVLSAQLLFLVLFFAVVRVGSSPQLT